MNSRLDSLANLFVHIYALALRFYPDRVQGEYAAEMQAVFCMRVADAARQGTWRLFILVGREVRDLPIAVLSAHLDVLGGRLQPFFPSTSDQTSWLAALLSLLPVVAYGLLAGLSPSTVCSSPPERSPLFPTSPERNFLV